MGEQRGPCPSDFGWTKAAWGKQFGQWALGAASFLWDLRGKPDYDLMLRMIGEHRITTFCAPPTVYRALVLEDLSKYEWSGLRHCVSAGESLNPEVIKVWRDATGLTIYDGYGQTETVNLLANYRCMEVRPGSMGSPRRGLTSAWLTMTERCSAPARTPGVPSLPSCTASGGDPVATSTSSRSGMSDSMDEDFWLPDDEDERPNEQWRTRGLRE